MCVYVCVFVCAHTHMYVAMSFTSILVLVYDKNAPLTGEVKPLVVSKLFFLYVWFKWSNELKF